MPSQPRTFNPLRLLFVIAGVVLLAVACYNYLQGGAVGAAFVIGLLSIFIGLILGRRGSRGGAD